MLQSLDIYIDFQWDDYANNPLNYFYSLNSVITLAYQHHLNVYYSPTQLDDFKNNCNDWEENFIVSKSNFIASILEDALPVNPSSYFFTVVFSELNTTIIPDVNPIINAFKKNTNNSLISIFENQGQKTLLKVNSANDFEKVIYTLVTTPQEILNWIWQNGEVRNFNLSPKHGENGIGHWTGESSLLCNRERAQELLNISIPDFREKNRLFVFDERFNTFLEFFFEGDNPQKQWHGFHLEEKDWQQRVPKSIRTFYGKN